MKSFSPRWSGILAVCLGAVIAVGGADPVSAAEEGSSGASRVITTLIPIATGAREIVSLKAGFAPYRLGSSTSIEFGFAIKSPPHTVQQPLIGINLAMPDGLGAGTTRLGIATCNAYTVREEGIERCPPDSFVGVGSAVASVPIGPAIISEHVKIGLFAAASQSGHLELLYGAEGLTPVFSVLTFRGEILEGRPPYGEEIATFIPPIETLPEAPYASVVSMQSTIGPKHLTYYKRVRGRRVAFHPEGIELPKRCPRGGFRFKGTFTFLDGTVKTSRVVVPCPGRARTRRG